MELGEKKKNPRPENKTRGTKKLGTVVQIDFCLLETV